MTGDVINLRRARKEKARAEKVRVAAENRAAFGRTKAEKERAAREHARISRELDQAKLTSVHEDEGGAS